MAVPPSWPMTRMSIEVWSGRPYFDGLDSLRFKQRIECPGEFGVEVVDQVRGHSRFPIGQQHEVAGLLDDPGCIWMSRHASDDDAARSDVNEKQDKIIDQ